jgi:serine/threonine protein kinase
VAEVGQTLREGRFVLRKPLGGGYQVQTFLADDTASGESVVVKVLSLDNVESWKAMELFERRTGVLRQMDHPGVPRWIDAFDVEPELFLVQSFFDGRSLEEAVRSDGPMSTERVLAVVRSALDVLAYLHAFSPPVVHRDVKPANLIERADGSVGLVDFGVVQLVQLAPEGASTVAGTSGYAPTEQLMGRAVPASDLYALAATAVYLLSGEEPAELPVVRMRLDWRSVCAGVDERLERFLDAALEAMPEDRVASVDEARGLLAEGAEPRSALVALPPSTLERIPPTPSDVDIRANLEGQRLTIEMPDRPDGLGQQVFVLMVLFPLIGGQIGLAVSWTAALVAVLLAALGIAAGMAWVRHSTKGSVRLVLDRENGWYEVTPDFRKGELSDIVGVGRGLGPSSPHLCLATQGNMIPIAPRVTEEESRWLSLTVKRFLGMK